MGKHEVSGAADKVQDPVCGMMVDPDQRRLEYRQMHFAFCSDQCRERFIANPGLYVGGPGRKAPRQERREVHKYRRMHLEAPLPEGRDRELKAALQALMGVRKVVVEGQRVEITYDLLEVTAEQIEAVIVGFGAGLGEGWSERLRRAFVHFQEEEQLISLELPPPMGPAGHED